MSDLPELPPCPQCKLEYTYLDGSAFICVDHDIDCKIDGVGAMALKSEFVSKA